MTICEMPGMASKAMASARPSPGEICGAMDQIPTAMAMAIMAMAVVTGDGDFGSGENGDFHDCEKLRIKINYGLFIRGVLPK